MVEKNSLGQASVPAVNQYLQLAKSLKLETSGLLQEIGIAPAQLSDSSGHISGLKFQQLIASLLELSGDELFGLHTSKFVQPGSYSVLGFITMNCENLGQAITKIQPFEKLVGDMGTTSIYQQGHRFKISWLCNFPDKLVRRHMVDNCLASWLTFARYLVDQKCDPTEVWFTRKAPSTKQKQEYQKIFNCPVLFAQSSDSIFFDRALLDLPLHRGNKQLLPALESHAKEMIESLSKGQNIISLTRKLIHENLESGKYYQQDIARQLGISGKTLQRRLKSESTHFQHLLDQVRLEQAFELLKKSALNITQISLRTGFKEPRSFYRWFYRLTQQTPGEYRQLARIEN